MEHKDVHPTRIVLAAMPTLMGDMIEKMFSVQADLLVVTRIAPGEDVCVAVRRNRADVVIMTSADKGQFEAAATGAFSWRPTKVLTISETGERAMVWVLRLDGTPLGELSEEGLAAAARVGRPV